MGWETASEMEQYQSWNPLRGALKGTKAIQSWTPGLKSVFTNDEDQKDLLEGGHYFIYVCPELFYLRAASGSSQGYGAGSALGLIQSGDDVPTALSNVGNLAHNDGMPLLAFLHTFTSKLRQKSRRPTSPVNRYEHRLSFPPTFHIFD